jgi:hypothetical protein
MLAGTAVQCLAIVWYVALGSAIGRFAAPLLAGLAGGVAGFAATLLMGDAVSGHAFRLLAFGSSTVSRLGLQYNAGYLAGQAAILAITAALCLLLPIRMRGSARVPTLKGVGAGIALAVVIGGLPQVLPKTRLVERPSAPTSCSGSTPQVCVFLEHRRLAAAVNAEVRVLSHAAIAAGYDALVADRVVESSRTYRPGGPGIQSFSPPDYLYKAGRIPIEEMAYMLVDPVHCPQLSASVPPSVTFYSRLYSVTETWLGLADPGTARATPPGLSIKHLTADEARKVLDDFAHCDLDGRA